MSYFVDDIHFVTVECCECGVPFAMTQDLNDRCRRDHSRSFYCPNGHGQVYSGKTEEQKLKEQLDQEKNNVTYFKNQARQINKSYQKIRERVKNGVCPCCNRTFQNLLNHMKTKHPEFGKHDILKTLRNTYGLSQVALAEEIGVYAQHISLFENNKPVTHWAESEIEQWIAQSA